MEEKYTYDYQFLINNIDISIDFEILVADLLKKITVFNYKEKEKFLIR